MGASSVELETFPSNMELSRLTGGKVAESTISRIFSPDPEQQRWPSEKVATMLSEAIGVDLPRFYEVLKIRRSRSINK